MIKYILLSISIIILLYAGYGFAKCIQAIGDLTEFGKGYLTGSIILLIVGSLLLLFSIKKIRTK